ncbi:integrase core domain-containing protein, partial [Roseobacter sinensis]
KPSLLSDNGASYISGELADWLEDQQMDHVRGAPDHPQTQGSEPGPGPQWGRVSPVNERWHQTLKNVRRGNAQLGPFLILPALLENDVLPGDLRQQIDAVVEHYNHRRYHESLGNLTPAGVYFGRGNTILKQREGIKRKTIEARRSLHRKSAASSIKPDAPDTLLNQA